MNRPVDNSEATTQADLRRFWPELTPTWIAAALLSERHQSQLRPEFSSLYLDGSARPGGLTAPVVAACNPGAHVTVWSPHPSALAATETLRRRASIENLTITGSLEPLQLGLPDGQADLLVIDQVLDAADDQQRAQFLELASAALRPGGTICVRYRTAVGWSEIAPVVHLVRHMVARNPRPTIDAVSGVHELLRQLRAGDASYLVERPVVAAWLDDVLAMSAQDMVSAYVDTDLRPLSHSQLRSAMTSIGCDYVGNAQVGDALNHHRTESVGELVDSIASPTLREAFDDLAVRRTSRVDLFQLGPNPLTKSEHTRLLGSLSVIGLPTSLGEIRGRALPQRIQDALATGPATIAELEPDPSLRVDLLRQLMADHLAHPVAANPEPAAATPVSVEKLNRLLGSPPTPTRDRLVASPLIGSAVPATPRPSRAELLRLGVR